MIDPALVTRFAADLDALVAPGERVGVAVSGGPDSLALLLLAVAARPGLVEAASVDHRLRPESASEAAMVAAVCDQLGVPHTTLTVDWDEVPKSQVQAAASFHRYRLLCDWAQARDLGSVATAHHLDDQAETLLMRLNRGSGVMGLAGIRITRPLGETITLIRPLILWRHSQLESVCATAKLIPVVDPGNDDPRFDRTHARQLLAANKWLDPRSVAQSAHHLAEAEEALEWIVNDMAKTRVRRKGKDVLIDARDLPTELQRRLVLIGIEMMGGSSPRGPDLKRAVLSLFHGSITTLGDLKMIGEPVWRLTPAPPRRR